MVKKSVSLCLFALMFPVIAVAENANPEVALDLTRHPIGYFTLVVFVLAYGVVVLEEFLHLRKSKPVTIAAGIIWAAVAWVYMLHGDTQTVNTAVRHVILEYGELFLFLLVAMTYVNTLDERGVFQALRIWLVSRGFSLRTIFWLTGILAFFVSPVIDNLTTALLMSSVAMAVGGRNKTFVVVASINIVVAANAGGAFSPFGDITTLMVWQKGVLEFTEFFALFIPSLVNWLVPAFIMSLTLTKEKPEALEHQTALKYGAFMVMVLFAITLMMAVMGHNFLHLPPVIGMMTGLGVLKFYGYYLKRRDLGLQRMDSALDSRTVNAENPVREISPFNIFRSIERAEWDTLMFFYGIMLCVGGLGMIGYLAAISQVFYQGLGATQANILIGLLSAVIDNIPVMYAVLTMMPEMSDGQWLLVTMTAGVGGSLLSIGSAAGVAVMGQARGVYTFFAHLKWTWAIALGYAASIAVHFLVNAALF